MSNIERLLFSIVKEGDRVDNGTFANFAQLLMDHRWKTSLPTHADLLKTLGAQEVKEHFQKRKLKEKVYYDRHSGKELPPLSNGERVTLQHGNKWVPATVIGKHHTPRSYIVQTPEGQKYPRNCRHLNKCQASQGIPTAWSTQGTHISKVSEVPVPTTEAPPPQVQKFYLLCVLIVDDCSRSLLTLGTMNTSLLLLQACQLWTFILNCMNLGQWLFFIFIISWWAFND